VFGYFRYQPLDLSQTWLAGVPLATLQTWQSQLQQAALNVALGANPISLSYAQGDGSRSVTRNITSMAQVVTTLQLVNAAIAKLGGEGNIRQRMPIRPYFR
jgi:hypothetical protein